MTRHTPAIHFSDVDLVQAYLASSAPMEVEPVSEERVVRFAFGWSTETEEERVLDALTRSIALRKDLIQIRSSLSEPEKRSSCVKEFLDYAITFAANALGALERGMSDWKSSFEGNLVVQHALDARSGRLAGLPVNVAWARSPSETDPRVIDGVIVDTEVGAPTILPLATDPVAEEGRLQLAIGFDPQFFSDHADQTLALSFAAGPLRIPLKAWKVSELPRDGRLTAPIPSSLAGSVPRTAIELSLYAS